MDNRCQEALLNDVILTRLFSFLCVQDLKNCRLVCKRWLYNSELKFRKDTRIFFGLVEHGKYSFMEIGVNQFEGPQSSNSNDIGFSFTTLGFKRPLAWTEPQLVNFFSNQGKYITDLKFKHIILRDKHQKPLESYNCMKLFLGNITSLKCLHIDRFGYHDTMFSVPLRPLQHLEELHLHYCHVILEGNEKLVLKSLTLCGVKIFSKNKESVALHEFVGFGKMKILKLKANSNLIFNISYGHKVTLESLTLSETQVMGWEYSNWRIGKLTLELIQLRARNLTMIIKEVQLGNFSGHFQLSFLPPSIKRLSMDSKSEKLMIDKSQRFPNLNYLNISLPSHIPLLNVFSNVCQRLNGLHLTAYGNDVNLPVSLIPKNVTLFKIEYNGLNLIADEFRELELLVLKSAGIELLAISKQVFRTNTIVIYTNLRNRSWDEKILKDVVLDNTNPWKKFLIGEFLWKTDEFKNSPLFLYFDKMASFYSIENGRGAAMTKFDFEKSIRI